MQTNRRALLGTLAVASATPVLLTGIAAAATADRTWPALVSDYRAKHKAWLGTIGLEDDLDGDVAAALAQLPPKPQEPPAEERDFRDMTVREWMAIEQTPERKALWETYERDKARWTAEQAEVRRRILAPAKARYHEAYAAYAAALNVLTSHPVAALGHLAEKISIIIAEYDNCDVPPEYFGDVLADVRRLGGEMTA